MRLVRSLVVVAGMGLTALSLAAVPALAQKRGGTLVQITQPEPPTLGSYVSTANPVGQVASKIYDGLLEYDFDLKPLPSLAESWTVAEDGKTVTFKLRSGVKFHDGKPFTSADVQFTFMEVLKKVHPRGINTFAEVTAVETPDPQTAIFRLNRPAPYMMAALSGYESPILRSMSSAKAISVPTRTRIPRLEPARSSSSNGGVASSSGWIAMRITGSPACPISTGLSSVSSVIPAPVRLHSRRVRPISPASVPFPTMM